MLPQVGKELLRGTRTVSKLEFLQMSQLNDARESAGGQQWTTSER